MRIEKVDINIPEEEEEKEEEEVYIAYVSLVNSDTAYERRLC